MSRCVSRLLFASFFVLLTACSGGESSTQPSGPANIAGTWNFSESKTDTEHSISCNNSGTMTINQSGSTFSGTYSTTGSCTGPGGSIDNSGTGSISGGQINGSSISFQIDFCEYSGTMSSSDSPNTMEGNGSCSFQEAGETFNFDATWQAGR